MCSFYLFLYIQQIFCVRHPFHPFLPIGTKFIVKEIKYTGEKIEFSDVARKNI